MQHQKYTLNMHLYKVSINTMKHITATQLYISNLYTTSTSTKTYAIIQLYTPTRCMQILCNTLL